MTPAGPDCESAVNATGACELRRKVAAAAAIGVVGSLLTQAATLRAAAEEQAHAPSWSALFWPTVNFAILVGVLYYFLKTPFVEYLRDRSTSIRRDIQEAAALTQSASAQMAEIDRKLEALPREIAALKQRGLEDTSAEEQRIAREATAERDRLLEQARREIEFQVRIAKREILEHAANVAVNLATERITKAITPADQERLADAYLDQVKPN